MVEHSAHLLRSRVQVQTLLLALHQISLMLTLFMKRRYPYSTHSASNNSITTKHLTNRPKVKCSSPDTATGILANGTDVNIIYELEDILKAHIVPATIA